MSLPEEVIEFWFGELDERGLCSADAVERWFKKSDAFDDEIRERFGALRKRMLAGELREWLDTPNSTVAYVVVLDQFSRNLGRGTPVMYEADERALRAAKNAIDDGLHVRLGIDFATALFMPFMHSETLADQDRCIGLFDELSASHPDVQRLSAGLKYAHAHRDIVARFDRFPHRNEILGRQSTPEEREFMKQPGSSF